MYVIFVLLMMRVCVIENECRIASNWAVQLDKSGGAMNLVGCKECQQCDEPIVKQLGIGAEKKAIV